MLSAEMVPRTRTDAVAIPIPRRGFTSDEYHRKGEAGVLSEDDRVELLDGEILRTGAIGKPHARSVAQLMALFRRRLVSRATTLVQNPIVLHARADFYASGKPRPWDVLLSIEVMDSSRGYDRALKLPLAFPRTRFRVKEISG